MTTALPEGWDVAPIGSVARVVGGGTPPSHDPDNFAPVGHGIPWVTPADLSGYRGQFISRGARDLSEAGLARCGATLMPKGTVLFSSRAPIGYVAIAANEISTNQGFKSFVLPAEIDPRFVYWQLKHLKPEAEAIATGTTFKELSGAAAATLPLRIAPAAEQTRIADQLDTLLARIQACQDRLEAIPALLKRFRKAVLGAASDGSLTADWRDERETSAWIPTSIGDLLDGKPRNGYSPRAVDYETSVRSLTLSATTSGRFLSQHTKFIDESVPPDSHLWLEPGDILIQRANTLEYVGVSAIFDGPSQTFIYPDLMMKCRANNRVDGRFLYLLLSTESTRRYFRDHATGTAGNMPKINQQTVMSAPVHLPPMDEQLEIVRRADRLLRALSQVEQRHTVAAEHTRRLAPLALAKAFRGELVPQDPRDEPASVLLARIATQRNARTDTASSRTPRRGRLPRAPKETAAMTKSRQDDDVMGQPYLAEHLRRIGTPTSADALFKVSELPVADFYKQLAWEVEQGHVTDNQTTLEPGHAAG
ncbi:restriction endonuclease subunit S [Zoogloeaceae bacterium G21618-S1]|nr:restriction endonuclease subunit S [Zoogloeaceae bacterium G21618-S1]